eukprot:73852_1
MDKQPMYAYYYHPLVITHRLYVKRENASTIKLDIKPTNTVKDIKTKIYKQANIPIKHQTLIFEDHVLSDDNKTMQECNITHKSIIKLQEMQTTSPNNDRKQQIEKLYNEFKQILNANDFDIGTLRNDIRLNEINEFCQSMHFNVKEKIKFRKLMRLLHSNEHIIIKITKQHKNPTQQNVEKKSNLSVHQDPTYKMNILVVGDNHVGKTNLIQNYTQQQFQDNKSSLVHRETLRNQSIDITITESRQIQIAGDNDVIIICYDINNSKSYEYCLNIRTKLSDYIKSDDTVIMLVGCKSDVGYSKRECEEAKVLNIMNDCEWKRFNFWALECSAKTGSNVRNIFITAAELFMHQIANQIDEKVCNKMFENEELISRKLISLALDEDDGIKWTKIESKDKGIEIEYAKNSQDSVVTVRSSVKTTVSVDEFYDFIHGQKNGIFKAKKHFDKLCLECKAIKRYDNDRCLVYSAYKAPDIKDYFISARDFCYLQVRKRYTKYKPKCNKIKSDSIVALVGYDANNTIDGYIQKQNGKVRARLHMTGFVLQKIKGLHLKYKSKAYYILKMDPCGWIPKIIVNATAKEKGYDIQWIRDHLPELIKNQKNEKINLVTGLLDEKEMNQLLVYGYIRQFNINLLQHIMRLIELFYTGMDEFTWNMDKCGSKIYTVDSRTITTKFATMALGCLSNQIVSCDLYNWYEWEFELRKYDAFGSEINFGYVISPEQGHNWKPFLEYGNTLKLNPLFVTVKGNPRYNYFRLYEKKKAISLVNTKKKFTIHIRAGDRFKLKVDFKLHTVELFYNGEYINCVYNKGIPKVVIPAVSLIKTEISVVQIDYNKIK